MTNGATFDDLRGMVGKDPRALQIIGQVETSGGQPGDAALQLINQGHAPGGAQTEKGWSAQYRSSKELQAEFGSEAAYIALRKDEHRKRR